MGRENRGCGYYSNAEIARRATARWQTIGERRCSKCRSATRLMLSQENSGASKESILYLRVADIAAVHDALKQRGVKLTHAPHMTHRHADGTKE